ncbi:transcription factor, putative [Bodo saltans]|uniref:Transcription factor, putative n=1 Tax=Bodo saltans TaxID=75058 RepID=A0A0S4ITR2_BODSA|nr:transcription factor, putative [Bodo saltans]|eukprot:CUF86599.1 transcription factor, putative [Bodo saltans]
MSCPHPQSAQHVDRARGTVTCAICGEVITDQQLELDPLFARGERTNTQGRSNLRSLGQPRPMRTTIHTTPVSQRPSVEIARRNMYNIARSLEISADMAEQATGIYKLAVTNNAVVGARTSILCACLYAVCRREGTNHVIYDFADATKESPYEILKYMRFLCDVTHTSLPPLDVSLFVYRFSEQLELGDRTRDIAICALKLIRAMRDDWIEYGRRPLGVVAAALVIACHTFAVPRTPEQLCGMVRLTAGTIHKRLAEFLNTPTASLDSIDNYVQNSSTAPPSFVSSSGACSDDSIRNLATTYYELVAEAKQSLPATPERCERWKTFIIKHCEVKNEPLDADICDLTKFTPKEQLTLLGLPHAVPLDESTVPETGLEPLTIPTTVEESTECMKDLIMKNSDIKDLSSVQMSERVVLSTCDFMSDWELIKMPPLSRDTDADLEDFIVRDNEQRLRLEQIAKEQYKGEYDRGAPRPLADVQSLIQERCYPRRKRARDQYVEHTSLESALQKALKGKGASTIKLSQLDALIPGLEDGAQSDNGSVDDDWY